MDIVKNVPGNTITRDVKYLAEPTGNIYESVVVMYKRANQIALAEKKELNKKLEDFKNERDTMEEVFENKEQIEISKYYEHLPKPDLIAIKELNGTDVVHERTFDYDIDTHGRYTRVVISLDGKPQMTITRDYAP